MEIMQPNSANRLDGLSWRSHIPPYNGHLHHNLHDQLRQQMISPQHCEPLHIQNNVGHTRLSPPLEHPIHQVSHQPDQSHHRHLNIVPQHQRRNVPPTQSKELQNRLSQSQGSSMGGRGSVNSGIVSPTLHMNNLSLQNSPSSAASPSTPTPSATPSPGKSNGKDGDEKKGEEEWEQYNAGAAFLGPTLWDKTLSYDTDLKVSLEYMDLDEFLNENGIPVEECKRAMGGNTASSNGGTGVGIPNTSPIKVSPSPLPSSPVNSPPMGSGMGACPQGISSSMPNNNTSTTTAPGGSLSVRPPACSPENFGDYSSSVSSPESPDPHSPLQVHEPDSARASQGRELVEMMNDKLLGSLVGATAMPTSAGNNNDKEGRLEFALSPNDLALATVPGQDFDPRTRVFSEEELKPQPMIKKSRKQFVPHELKDDKYWARRRKNNMAAKRSRDARRLKENQIAMRANFLEKENNAMTAELQKAQAIVEALKKRLAMYEAV